jgi:hypothetical protein
MELLLCWQVQVPPTVAAGIHCQDCNPTEGLGLEQPLSYRNEQQGGRCIHANCSLETDAGFWCLEEE